MTKKKGLLIGFAGAAVFGTAIATGFIHEEKPKTPEDCLSDLYKATADIPLIALNDGQSVMMLTDKPEIKQQAALYMDCMDRYKKSKEGITLTFGW